MITKSRPLAAGRDEGWNSIDSALDDLLIPGIGVPTLIVLECEKLTVRRFWPKLER